MKGTYSNISGGASERRSFTGIYALGDICYAAAGYSLEGVTYEMNIIVIGNGNQYLYSEVAPGYVVSGNGTRTAPR